MYTLTDEQVDYILDDIRRNGIEIEDLQYNLLDHICCIIERELKDGEDFYAFYNRIKSRFYNHSFKEIEEETINLLTFKNYYVMKKAMIYSGAIAVAVLLSGSFFKIMHWPGAGILFVLGMVAFSLLFLPLVFIFKTCEMSATRDKIVLAAATVVGILYTMSALLLVMHWPGARVIWVSTLLITFFILLPLYFFNGIRKPEARINTIVTTIIIMGVLGAQFLLTPVRKTKEEDRRTTQVEQTKK